MSDRAVLTFHCAPADADAIAEALREGANAPVQLRAEQVRGRDFSDARTSEQVGGALDRVAIELVADITALDGLIAQACAARRRQPIRWRAVPVLAEGRAE